MYATKIKRAVRLDGAQMRDSATETFVPRPERLEFEGKSVAEAVRRAAETLGVDEKSVRYDVISSGARGIFRFLRSRSTRIRALSGGLEQGIAKTQPNDHPNATADTADERRDSAGRVSAESHEALQCYGYKALLRIIRGIDPDATVADASTSTRMTFHIFTTFPGLMIGKHGQTLDAIRHLIERIIAQRARCNLPVHVDIEGYHEARNDRIRNMALHLAEKAVRSGRDVSAGPMNAGERRMVHLALKTHPGVRTRSTGNGRLRKMMIIPTVESFGRRKGARQPAGRKSGAAAQRTTAASAEKGSTGGHRDAGDG